MRRIGGREGIGVMEEGCRAHWTRKWRADIRKGSEQVRRWIVYVGSHASYKVVEAGEGQVKTCRLSSGTPQ